MQDDQTPDPTTDGEAAPAELGTWLRDARERAGVGVEATAAVLHLDPATVAALEAERFDALGAPVFVRGHLRALAGHYGLDPAEAIRRYEATAGTAAVRPPDLIVQYQRPVRRNRALPILAGLAVALIIVALVVALLPREGTPQAPPPTGVGERPSPAPTPEVTPAETAAPAADDFAARLEAARDRSGAAAAATPTVTEPPTTVASQDVARQPAAASAAAPAQASGLVLRFSDTCWYEVRDADGRRLATGTANAGDNRRVDGPRPLSVTLGVADAVSMTLDGAPVDIPPASRRGRSARLTLR